MTYRAVHLPTTVRLSTSFNDFNLSKFNTLFSEKNTPFVVQHLRHTAQEKVLERIKSFIDVESGDPWAEVHQSPR